MSRPPLFVLPTRRRTFRRQALAGACVAALVTASLMTAAAAQAATMCADAPTAVYQAVNPTTTATLYTRTSGEAADAARYGFTSNSEAFFAASQPRGALTQPVHRLFRAASGDFMYSRSSELSLATSAGYVDQGVEFYAAAAPSSCLTGVTRYRKGGMHRFAVSQSEQADLAASGWTSEGVHFYAGQASGLNIRTDPTSPVTTGPVTTGPDTTGPATNAPATPTPDAPTSPDTTSQTKADGSGPAAQAGTGVDTAAAVVDVTQRGALPIGSTTYPVPTANVKFVATSGNDTAAGSQAAPYRTLAKALSAVPAGGTIVVRAGTYHESVIVTKAVTIQAYPREAVWFDGSRAVSGWTKAGTTWTAPWAARFDHSLGFSKGNNDTVFLKAGFPLAGWPDQAYLNGAKLRQVNPGQVSAGTFAVDYAAGKLIVGSDPSGKTVTASDLSQAVWAQVAGVSVKGIGFRKYATSIPESGTVRIGRGGGVIDNVVIEDSSTIGLSIVGKVDVNRVTVTRAGMMGVHGEMADGATVRNSLVQEPNAEDFNDKPASGGMKFTRSRQLTVDNNKIVNGHTVKGLWLDASCYDIKVVRNQVQDNGKAQIQIELTAKGVVADNYVSGGDMGIYLEDSGDLTIANNVAFNTTHADIYNMQDSRRPSNYPVGRDPRQPLNDPTNPWLVRNNRYLNNVFGTDTQASYFQFYVLDVESNIDADTMNLRVDGNVFSTKAVNTQATMIGWGSGDNKTVERFESQTAFNAAKGTSWRNAQVPAGTAIESELAQAATMTHGVPMPADVASALGRPQGSTHLGTFWTP